MRGNNYANWDDGFTREPPEPPQRPSFWQWRMMGEQARMDYYGSVTGYLMAVCGHDEKLWQTWNELHFRYLKAWSQQGSGDAAVKP